MIRRGENMNAGVNVGDIIFQLFALGVLISFIAILFLFWRSSKKRKEQLNRIEDKLDLVTKKELIKLMDYPYCYTIFN
jgi:hypothetical protein